MIDRKILKEIATPIECPNCSSRKIEKDEIVGAKAFQCLNCGYEFPDPDLEVECKE